MTTETLTTIASAVTADGAYEGIWVQLLGTIATLLGVLLTFIAKKVADRIVTRINADEQEKAAIDAILEGMAKAQDEIVREAKRISKDGTLTSEEIEKARTVAYEHAMEVATGPVKNLLIQWGKTRVDSVIKQLLNKFRQAK